MPRGTRVEIPRGGHSRSLIGGRMVLCRATDAAAKQRVICLPSCASSWAGRRYLQAFGALRTKSAFISRWKLGRVTPHCTLPASKRYTSLTLESP